ncbi:MAG: HAMP domain-containing histidine kinase [Firmicutes bacterium]|nr:HAMP domain-containing histidine kinase [Bacillota bacterium]
MKFWQKIFLWTLVIFVLAFDVGAYILTTHACEFHQQRERENGGREQSIILTSVSARIANMERIYQDASENKERLDAMVKPLTEYYEPQGVLLALYDGETAIGSKIAEFDKALLHFTDAKSKNTTEGVTDGKRYVFVASKLPDYPHLTLVYARDVSQIDAFRQDVSRIFIILNLVVIPFMAAAIYLLLRCMNRPIAQLNQMTSEIASGAYDKRVRLNRRDEFGNLEKNFNLMADSVKQHMTQLAQAAEERQQFIDALTHEMKTPMTAILGYAEYLQYAKSSEPERELAVQHLYDSALRLKNLSDKLLELAYLRGEKIALQKVDMAALFQTLASSTQQTLAARAITLHTEADIPFVNGDEILLLSMVTNLVENAAKASDPGSRITVRAFQDDGPVIEVLDTGQGMTQEEIKKITQPFYRVDKSRSRRFGGVGLGLAIVSQIVELHGGRLAIDSVPGQGTRVRIYFTDC